MTFQPHKSIHQAAQDLLYLLNRKYTRKSALKIIVDHYQLSLTDKMILYRNIYPDAIVHQRLRKALTVEEMEGKSIAIDGYNILITIEVALQKGFLAKGNDRVIRDVAGKYRSYYQSNITQNALSQIMLAIKTLNVTQVHFLYDRPISRSGLMSQQTNQLIKQHNILGDSKTCPNVDQTLIHNYETVCSSDSVILDKVNRFFDLSQFIVTHLVVPLFSLNPVKEKNVANPDF